MPDENDYRRDDFHYVYGTRRPDPVVDLSPTYHASCNRCVFGVVEFDADSPEELQRLLSKHNEEEHEANQ